MYAAAIRGQRLMPVFYKRFPGSVRDLSAFESMREEMGARNFIAVADKGFVSEEDQRKMEKVGLPYLAPLKRNSGEYVREPLVKPGRTGFRGRFLYNGRVSWHYEAPAAEGQLLCGTICLKTSLMEMDAQELYSTYKTREEVEQIFDTYKAEEDFATTGTVPRRTREVSCAMRARIYGIMRR